MCLCVCVCTSVWLGWLPFEKFVCLVGALSACGVCMCVCFMCVMCSGALCVYSVCVLYKESVWRLHPISTLKGIQNFPGRWCLMVFWRIIEGKQGV